MCIYIYIYIYIERERDIVISLGEGPGEGALHRALQGQLRVPLLLLSSFM